MQEKSASEQIDAIIQETEGWRREKLAQLRAVIKKADPDIIEDVKWKKPSKPSGVPVWVRNGNLVIADTLKNAVRLTFPKGGQIKDPDRLFNTRLDSKTVRAIDFHDDDDIEDDPLMNLVVEAIRINLAAKK